jgi:hypothetical protein
MGTSQHTKSMLVAGAMLLVAACVEPSSSETDDCCSFTAAGFVISGQELDGKSGYQITAVGDVNADGFDDVVVEAGWPATQRFYVVFGKSDQETVELDEVAGGVGGFVIDGLPVIEDALTGVALAQPVTAAGDVNGDGWADLLIGTSTGSVAVGEEPLDRAYLVHGKEDTEPVTLAAIEAGSAGQVIEPDGEWIGFGSAVAGVGDVNGDSLDDILVAAASGDGAYVIFGSTDELASPSQIAAQEGGGFMLAHAGGVDTVSAVGDVNGDQLADLVVGRPSDQMGVGRVFVVFGKDDGARVELTELSGSGSGFVIEGDEDYYSNGARLGRVGDANGDGRDDILVAATGRRAFGDAYEGCCQVYVVFGKDDATDVALGSEGVGLIIESGADSPAHIDGIGDVNGDNLADIIINRAPSTDPEAEPSGAVAVFGRADSSTVQKVDIDTGAAGFIIDPPSEPARYSWIGGGNADINGDGNPDLVVAAPEHGEFGQAFVVFGGLSGS